MQERISTFIIFLNKENRRSVKERRLCSYKKYQQKAYKQFAISHRLVGEDQEDHPEQQKLLKTYIAAKKTSEPRKCGRTAHSVMTFLLMVDRYGTFLTFLPFLGNTLIFSPLLARCHLGRIHGRLTSCRKWRKRISAVIARELYGYFFSAVSLLSRIHVQPRFGGIRFSESFEILII